MKFLQMDRNKEFFFVAFSDYLESYRILQQLTQDYTPY